ncbi:HET-domain-containing protein [Stipitochalara longipes BDJ]|nr:HET-domain-containing protein [Stipitochalara longipes BDJ]
MASPTYSELYWQRPELQVQETESHRCAVCSSITYDKFRAEDPAAEYFRPKTLIIGSYAYIAKSAFAGCWVCRLLLRQISQTATSLRASMALYDIAAVGLKLSLDDELTLHCYDEEGYDIILNDLSCGVVDMEDGEWSETFNLEDAMLEKHRLEYDLEEDILPPSLKECASNRLILNPDVHAGQFLVMSWLSTCGRKHKNCSIKSEEPILPTRVLDVGGSSDSECSRLILTEGRRDEYVTLSHCWGKTHHTMSLTKENMASFMEGIKDADMPKTFQQAIMMIRGIGLRYLWIDSMCIIQPTGGDNSDWEKEGAKMGDTYRNSTFTIAASSATDNTEGCLFGKAASQFDVHPIPLFTKPVQRNWDEFSKTMGRDPNWFPMMMPQPASWLNHVQNSPLNSRAWVLQERVLSPRILHCTMQGFFWECSELRASEYEPLGCKFDYFFRDHGVLNANKLLTENNESILGMHWRKIVERYCQLGISVSSDRLPALAGLANIIQEHTKDTYIAGHWRSSLVSSLLWYRLDADEKKDTYARHSAPSWSWASISSEVKFTSLNKGDFPAQDPKDYNLIAEVIDLDFKALGSSPFNWISRSRLTLRGRLLDKSSPGGLPNFEITSKSGSETWRGYKPTSELIPQIAAIQISRTPDHASLASDEEIATVSGRDRQAHGEASRIVLPESIHDKPESSMASTAADHDKLQAAMKEHGEALRNSQVWKELEETERLEREKAEREAIRSVRVTYDDPNEANTTIEGVALLEILRAGYPEGVVLRQVPRKSDYQRIGYFESKTSDLFESVPKVELTLV